ncbi:helix-turn-helix domain-containing protein [Deinococcus koreensis]|uniref:helix-turn-helix domain-containing protein n=1 Tax=Deinococcus koreensis TaxID=2054903 RepID=UPI0013FDE55B|nr:helix-turn-helix domain-containing protein [Deinococcus koreensis]
MRLPSFLGWLGYATLGLAQATSTAEAGPAGWWLLSAGGGAALAAGLWWTITAGRRRSALGDYLRPDRPARGYLGVTRSGAALRPDESRRCQHVLVTGRPAEVARRYLQPNLLLDAHDGVSVVIFDVSGAASTDAADLRPLLVPFTARHDVQVFAPFEAFTLRFPLLDGLGSAEEAAGLATALLGAPESDPSPEHRAQSALLEGLLLDAAARQGSLQQLLNLVQAGPDALGAHLARAEKGTRQRTHLYFSLRHEQQVGVAQTLTRILALFASDDLDRATSAGGTRRPGDGLDVGRALSGPVAIYLRLPAETGQSESGRALVRALQHVVLHDLLRAGSRLGGAPPQHVSVYLPLAGDADGQLPELPALLAPLRLTRVACHLPTLPPSAVPFGLDAALFGHTLTLGREVPSPGELRLADGRVSAVWLPALSERRAGRARNPLFEGARQTLTPASPQGLELTRDLVLQRLLSWRAAQVVRPALHPGAPPAAEAAIPPVAPDPGELLGWVDEMLATRTPWQSQDQQLRPSGEVPAPSTPQLARWSQAGWLDVPAAGGSPLLTPAGLSLLGESRRAAIEARLLPEEAPVPVAPTPPDDPGFDNPVEARQLRLLALLAEHRDLTPAQIVSMTSLPETTVRRDLGVLEESGQVESARVAGKRRYRLRPNEASGAADSS